MFVICCGRLKTVTQTKRIGLCPGAFGAFCHRGKRAFSNNGLKFHRASADQSGRGHRLDFNMARKHSGLRFIDGRYPWSQIDRGHRSRWGLMTSIPFTSENSGSGGLTRWRAKQNGNGWSKGLPARYRTTAAVNAGIKINQNVALPPRSLFEASAPASIATMTDCRRVSTGFC